MSNTRTQREGKKLLGYPESYTGPKLRVTQVHRGIERYVYDDGTLDLGSTVLTNEVDRYEQMQRKRRKGDSKGPQYEWVKVAEGRRIPRMPLDQYMEIIEGLPSSPEIQAILRRINGGRNLHRGEGWQGAMELYGFHGPELEEFVTPPTEGEMPGDRPSPIAYEKSVIGMGPGGNQ